MLSVTPMLYEEIDQSITGTMTASLVHGTLFLDTSYAFVFQYALSIIYKMTTICLYHSDLCIDLTTHDQCCFLQPVLILVLVQSL